MKNNCITLKNYVLILRSFRVSIMLTLHTNAFQFPFSEKSTVNDRFVFSHQDRSEETFSLILLAKTTRSCLIINPSKVCIINYK